MISWPTSKGAAVFLEHLLVNSLGRTKPNIGETFPFSRPRQNWSKRLFSAVVAVMNHCIVPHLGMIASYWWGDDD